MKAWLKWLIGNDNKSSKEFNRKYVLNSFAFLWIGIKCVCVFFKTFTQWLYRINNIYFYSAYDCCCRSNYC